MLAKLGQRIWLHFWIFFQLGIEKLGVVWRGLDSIYLAVIFIEIHNLSNLSLLYFTINFVKTFHLHRYQDQDAQSDTGSERSVTPATFVATTQPHPAHHQTPQGIPYHMHHSLIQHLTDMRDLYGSHQSITGISNHHNSNWKIKKF